MPATQPCLSSLAWLERPLNVWGQNHIPRSTHSCLVVFLWFSRAPWRMNPRGRSQHSPVSSPKAESLFVTWYSEEAVPRSAGSLSRETQVGDFKTKFLDAWGEAPPPPNYFLTSLATEAWFIRTADFTTSMLVVCAFISLISFLSYYLCCL